MSDLLPPLPRVRAIGEEPLPGYRLIAPLGKGGFGEVWKCLAPGGLAKAIKFVSDEADPTSLEQEYEAFQRVKAIRHPFLLTLERVELVGHDLITVMELADRNMANRFDECRTQGLHGIPRAELLAYLVDTAEALDYLSRKHGLQHLDVKPANLFLIGEHVKVGDYGLVSNQLRSNERDHGVLNRGLTPRYVAPEILDSRIDARSDQYSLSLVYQEMLTGIHAYPGPSSRQFLMQHKLSEPNVEPLPSVDREPVRIALSKSPEHRYPSCLAFIEALMTEPSKRIRPRTTSTIGVASLTRLVTPGASPEAGNTQRLGHALTHRHIGPVGEPEPAANDLEVTPLGKIRRSVDPAGRNIATTILKLDGGTVNDIEFVLDRIERPHPQLWQSLAIPHPRQVGFVLDGRHQSIGDWLAQRAADPNSRMTMHRATEVLAPIAAALDELHTRCGFPHGLIGDRTIVTDGKAFGLWGYGIAELHRRTRADLDWLEGEAHLAPELLRNKPGLACDQFGLALVFLQLLGAWKPAKKARSDRPSIDWNAVGRDAIAAIRKALHSDPAERHPSCTAFLQSLPVHGSTGIVLDDFAPVESLRKLTTGAANADGRPSPSKFAKLLTHGLIRTGQPVDAGTVPVALPDGRMTLRFPVKWTHGFAELKASAFRSQFGYSITPMASDTILLKPRNRLHDAPAPVELVVRWPVIVEAGVGEVVATGRSMHGLDPSRAADEIKASLERFRRAVHNMEDRRRAPRVKVDVAIRLYPISDDLEVSAPIAGRLRDASTTGFCAVFAGGDAPRGHAFAWFGEVPELVDCALLARAVRWMHSEATGQTIVGFRFVHAPDGT